MPIADPVARHLDRVYRRCCSPRHHRQVTLRWAAYPALRGRDLDDVRRVAATPGDVDHNAVLADLLRGHQHGDTDATTVLLVVLIPFVHSDPALTVVADMVADRWAALGKLLAVTDPAEAEIASPRSFLRTLAGRMRRDAGRSFRHGLGPGADTNSASHRRHPVDTLHPELIDTYPDRRLAPVEDIVLARIELAAIAAHVRDGTIPARRWRQLVNHRLTDTAIAADPGTRSNVRNTTRRLAHAVGHAA